MKNIRQFNRRYNKRVIQSTITVVLLVMALVFAFILFYTKRVENRIQGEAEAMLQHVSSQNSLAIEDQVLSKQKFLVALARSIQNSNNFDIETNLESFKNYIDIYNFYNMGLIDKEGICYTTLGDRFDLSKYDYYKNGFEGARGISSSYESEDKTLMLNIYTVPVYKGRQVEMVLTATYSAYDFANLLNIKSFDGLGESFVINSEGDLIAIPKNYELEQTQMLEHLKKNNKNIFKTMVANIEQDKTGYIEYSYKKETYLGFYQKIGINDWYLLSYVPKAYIYENADALIQDIQLANLLMGVVFCIFCSLLVFYYIKYQREISNIIFYDPLTGRENYEYLKMLFQKEDLDHSKDKSLFVLDIDKFKIINIMHGTGSGDRMILYLQQTFTQVLPEDKIYRNKADEFVGILKHRSQEEILQKLERFHNQILEDIKNNKIYHMNISIGICALEGYSNLQRIYSNALIAKNEIKGRADQFYNFFDAHMKEICVENRKIESEFELALQRKEFEVWYQPKYHMKRQEIVGAEALVRWRTQNGKLISPGKFIPLFEQNGQIIRLDEEIIHLVFQDIKEMRENQYPIVPVSINLSRLHLYHTGIIQTIEKLMQQYEIQPSEIIFEITESALLDNKDKLNHLIDSIHTLGFKVHMDDYGTGISSLSSLSSFVFDAIKLDKTFIDKIGNKKMNIIIQSTIQMAKDLDMEVIVEGAETEEQIEFLLENNCFVVQGFYFYKPLEKELYLQEVLKVNERKPEKRGY